MNCPRCIERRRNFFIDCGGTFGRQWCFDTHLTVSWPWNEKVEDPWGIIRQAMSILSKLMAGRKVGKFLRVSGVGPGGCPHAHFLIPKCATKTIEAIISKTWNQIRVDFVTEPITDLEGLLGYLFDRNYLVFQRDLNRIKRIRLISASRPMPCGFPSFRQEQQILKFRTDFLGKLPLLSEDFIKLINWNGKKSRMKSENFTPNKAC